MVTPSYVITINYATQIKIWSGLKITVMSKFGLMKIMGKIYIDQPGINGRVSKRYTGLSKAK